MIQSYMFRPSSNHPHVHNLCLKYIGGGLSIRKMGLKLLKFLNYYGQNREWYVLIEFLRQLLQIYYTNVNSFNRILMIPSSICFKNKLWNWGWPEIGRNIYFCIIYRTELCSKGFRLVFWNSLSEWIIYNYIILHVLQSGNCLLIVISFMYAWDAS